MKINNSKHISYIVLSGMNLTAYYKKFDHSKFKTKIKPIFTDWALRSNQHVSKFLSVTLSLCFSFSTPLVEVNYIQKTDVFPSFSQTFFNPLSVVSLIITYFSLYFCVLFFGNYVGRYRREMYS